MELSSLLTTTAECLEKFFHPLPKSLKLGKIYSHPAQFITVFIQAQYKQRIIYFDPSYKLA